MNKDFYSVSRIEDKKAVLEFPNGSFNEVPFSLLPPDVKEGNVLILNEKGVFVHDFQLEEERKQYLLNLQDDIFG